MTQGERTGRLKALRARVVTTHVVTYTEQELAERAAYAALARLAQRWRIRAARAAHVARAVEREARRQRVRETTLSRLADALRSQGYAQDDQAADVPRSRIRGVPLARVGARPSDHAGTATRTEQKVSK